MSKGKVKRHLVPVAPGAGFLKPVPEKYKHHPDQHRGYVPDHPGRGACRCPCNSRKTGSRGKR